MADAQRTVPLKTANYVLVESKELPYFREDLGLVSLIKALEAINKSLSISAISPRASTNVDIYLKLNNDTSLFKYQLFPWPTARYELQENDLKEALFLADVFYIVEQVREFLERAYFQHRDLMDVLHSSSQDNILETGAIVTSVNGKRLYKEDELIRYKSQLSDQVVDLLSALYQILSPEEKEALEDVVEEEEKTEAEKTDDSEAPSRSTPKPTTKQEDQGGAEGPEETQLEKEELPELTTAQQNEALRLSNALLLSNKETIKELLGFEFDSVNDIPLEIRQLLEARINQYLPELSPELLQALGTTNNQEARFKAFRELHQRLMVDSPFWATASQLSLPIALQQGKIGFGKDKDLFKNHLHSLTGIASLEPQALDRIHQTMDSLIISGASPEFLAHLSEKEFIEFFGITTQIDPAQMRKMSEVLSVYWVLRLNELQAVTGSSFLTLPEGNDLISRFVDRVDEAELYRLYSRRHNISQAEFHDLLLRSRSTLSLPLQKEHLVRSVAGAREFVANYSTIDTIDAMQAESLENFPLDRRHKIEIIKKEIILSILKEEKIFFVQDGLQLQQDSLDNISFLELAAGAETNPNKRSFSPALGALNGAADSMRAGQGETEEDRTRKNLDRAATMAAFVPVPMVSTAAKIWSAAPEPLKRTAIKLYTMFKGRGLKKILPIIGLGALGAGMALMYLARNFPLAFVGGALGSIFGPAGSLAGFTGGLWAHNAMGTLKGAYSSFTNNINGGARNFFGGMGNFFTEGLHSLSSSITNLTGTIVSGTAGGIIVGSFFIVSNTTSSFLQPLPTMTGNEISPFVTIEKVSQQGIKFENNQLPITIDYVVTIKADKGYLLTIREITDTLQVTTNTETRPGTQIAGRSLNLMGKVQEQSSSRISGDTIVLAPGDEPLVITYSETYDANYADSNVSNKVELRFKAELQAEGQEDLSADDLSAFTAEVICFGECPQSQGCWPASGFIRQMPYGSYSHLGEGEDAYDIATNENVNIYSPFAGTAYKASIYEGYGQHVVVNADNGESLVFAHMKTGSVTIGPNEQRIEEGKVLGVMGATGNVTGQHLHYEMAKNGTWSSSSPPSNLINFVPEPEKNNGDAVRSCYDY